MWAARTRVAQRSRTVAKAENVKTKTIVCVKCWRVSEGRAAKTRVAKRFRGVVEAQNIRTQFVIKLW